MISAIALGLLWWSGGGPLRAVETPELRSAPGLFAEVPGKVSGEAPGETSGGDVGASLEARSGPRIGDFESPKEVPEYEVLEEERDERDGTRGARLLVGTLSHTEEDYVLITRHLKARYARLDAVSVEFTDPSRTLRHVGGALIFNTPAGADYIGYVYGPPNTAGYYVEATY